LFKTENSFLYKVPTQFVCFKSSTPSECGGPFTSFYFG